MEPLTVLVRAVCEIRLTSQSIIEKLKHKFKNFGVTIKLYFCTQLPQNNLHIIHS